MFILPIAIVLAHRIHTQHEHTHDPCDSYTVEDVCGEADEEDGEREDEEEEEEGEGESETGETGVQVQEEILSEG